MSEYAEDSLFDLPPPPPRWVDQRKELARTSDPDTSKAAARALSTRETHMRALLTAYRDHGTLLDEEAGQYAGVEESHKRCADLRNKGFIERTEKRKGSSGREAWACTITREGARWL